MKDVHVEYIRTMICAGIDPETVRKIVSDMLRKEMEAELLQQVENIDRVFDTIPTNKF